MSLFLRPHETPRVNGENFKKLCFQSPWVQVILRENGVYYQSVIWSKTWKFADALCIWIEYVGHIKEQDVRDGRGTECEK